MRWMWIVVTMLVLSMGCMTGDDDTEQDQDPCMGRTTVCSGAYDLNVCEGGSTVRIIDCRENCTSREGENYYTGTCAPDPLWPEVFAYCACLEF